MIRRPRGGDRGSIALETVLLAPVLILAFAVVVVAGRVVVADGSVEAAARDGARQASLARTVDDATTRATTSAQAALLNEGLDCPAQVDVDATGLNREPGEQATVTVTVTCTVNLADLAVPGIPGTRTLTATFRSPVDPLRGLP